MSVSGSWTGFSSPTLVQSIDDDLTGFAWSPATSSIDIVYIQPSPPLTPMMARTSDWVQQQSVKEQAEKTESVAQQAQCAEPVTPPSRSITHEGLEASVDSPRPDVTIRQNLRKPKYDIESLLRMRYTQGAVPVMLRVKPEAIAGKQPSESFSHGAEVN